MNGEKKEARVSLKVKKSKRFNEFKSMPKHCHTGMSVKESGTR